MMEFGDYCIEDELFTSRMETELFAMFEEMDVLVYKNLPTSLTTAPIILIQKSYYQKFGVFLTQQEILDAYCRYAEGVFYE